ncbi:MAG: ADP-ribosylglycohydrolase family protein [Rhodothermia bacterium]|nr:ADP-ribosylglycohydrolase family protein [Rhodothermia bacterium]
MTDKNGTADGIDRFHGALVGLAVGDALGTALEFRQPGTFRPIRDMVGGGPFCLQPGQWTDDTSMALCLADSLISRGLFDPLDQMQRYVRWWREGYRSSKGFCFDIGGTVRQSLAMFEATSNPFSGSRDPRSAGNGSLMRLAPVVMFFSDQPAEAIRFAGESSRTTHAAAAAIDSCRYFGGLLVGALSGESRERILAPLYRPDGCWEKGSLVAEVEEVAAGSFLRREPPSIQGTGYVVRSLEAALWAFARAENFRDGCLAAVNLGDDADTTGAIFGQIAGAYWGMTGIPDEWLERLWMAEEIIELAERIFSRSSSRTSEAPASSEK